MTGQVLHHFLRVLLDLVHVHPVSHVLFHVLHHGLDLVEGHTLGHLEILDKRCEILFGEGLVHTFGHGVIKVGHALAAVHFVLVGLDGDASQGRVAGNGVGLPQIAVTSGKAVVEQLDQIDLAAGFRQGVEVFIVNVNIPFGMGLCDVRGNDVFIVEALGALGTVLEHGAHGGIRVDVGIFPLQVHVFSTDKGQGRIDLYQFIVHFTKLLVLRPVQDIGLCGFGVIGGNKLFLHHVLDLLHRGDGLHFFQLLHHRSGQLVQLLVTHFFGSVAHVGLENGAAYF